MHIDRMQPLEWTARARRLQAARDFIEENLQREDLTPAGVARALGISIRQLHLLFEPTGQSFSRYVLARRLERARSQLAHHPERTVMHIALACGIKSSSVFYRGFRDAFGVKPMDYRRSLRESGRSGSAALASPAQGSRTAR